jgi:enterochelin esterase-like enzyme
MKSNVEKISFYSKILKKEMAFLAYIPKEYDELEMLPVLYFFHGRSGDENILFDLEMDIELDDLIESKEIEPMIVVCPRIENSRGINSALVCAELENSKKMKINVGMYEDYFLKEIIPMVEKEFKVKKDRKNRYIGGASAGGYMALHIGFRYQELFSKIGGHMPVIELELDKEDEVYYRDAKMWREYSPLYLGRNQDLLPDLRVYLDAGDRDEGCFYEGCKMLHKILFRRAVNCENHVFCGNHSLEYIKSNLERYFKFYDV